MPIALCLGGVSMLAAYNGTIHANLGTSCGPIDVFGYAFNVDIDCLTVSRAELLLTVICFALATIIIIFGRGGREHSRW
ncbi:MAG: hypothetical protein ACR2JC_08775 [Chloroflexota bacterium]